MRNVEHVPHDRILAGIVAPRPSTKRVSDGADKAAWVIDEGLQAEARRLHTVWLSPDRLAR